MPVQGTGWGPPSQEGGALHFALGRRTPQSSLRPPLLVPGSEQRWPGPSKGGLGPPGPKSRGSSEGRSVLHESWAPRSWGPTGKRLLHRTGAPAARWPGPAMRGPTRPPGGSARGGASAEPEPARRERPESAGRPPRLPPVGPGEGAPRRAARLLRTRQEADSHYVKEQVLTVAQTGLISRRMSPSVEAASATGCLCLACHRHFSPAQGQALSQ